MIAKFVCRLASERERSKPEHAAPAHGDIALRNPALLPESVDVDSVEAPCVVDEPEALRQGIDDFHPAVAERNPFVGAVFDANGVGDDVADGESTSVGGLLNAHLIAKAVDRNVVIEHRRERSVEVEAKVVGWIEARIRNWVRDDGAVVRGLSDRAEGVGCPLGFELNFSRWPRQQLAVGLNSDSVLARWRVKPIEPLGCRHLVLLARKQRRLCHRDVVGDVVVAVV